MDDFSHITARCPDLFGALQYAGPKFVSVLGAAPLAIAQHFEVRTIAAAAGFLILFLATVGMAGSDTPPPEPDGYFVIEVVDEQTGRGVPMVELQTTNGVRYVTDWPASPRSSNRG